MNQEYISSLVARFPGTATDVSIGIVNNGETSFLDHNSNRERLFCIASLTKAFTAVSLTHLSSSLESGLDTLVSKVLPELVLPAHVKSPLSLRDLLCHTIGFGSLQGDLLWFSSSLNTEEVLARLQYLEPSGTPNTYAYCNLAYIIAGACISALDAEHRSFAEWIKAEILDPLGMKRSFINFAEASAQENFATPIILDRGVPKPHYPYDLENAGPAAGLFSCTQDMTKWIECILSDGQGTVLTAADFEQCFTPHVCRRELVTAYRKDKYPTANFCSYGLGFALRDCHKGNVIAEHGGGMPGFFSRLAVCREKGFGTIVVTNGEMYPLAFSLTLELIDSLLLVPRRSPSYVEQLCSDTENLEKDWQKLRDLEERPAVAPALPLEAYCGEYHCDAYGSLWVEQRGDRLAIRLQHHKGESLADSLGSHVFRVTWAELPFECSEAQWSWSSGRQRLEFTVRPSWVCSHLWRFARDTPTSALHLAATGRPLEEQQRRLLGGMAAQERDDWTQALVDASGGAYAAQRTVGADGESCLAFWVSADTADSGAV